MKPSPSEVMRAEIIAAFAAHEARAAARREGRPPSKKTKAPAVAAAKGLQEKTHEHFKFSTQDLANATQPRLLASLVKDWCYAPRDSAPALCRMVVDAGRCALLDLDEAGATPIWLVLDAIWFEHNPHRRCRIRQAMPGEFDSVEILPRQIVIVRAFSRGERARMPLVLSGELVVVDDVLDFDAVLDLLWHAVVRLPVGGEVLVSDVLGATPSVTAPASNGGEM
jgi:hypothetical protein